MFLCSNSYFWRVVRHGNVLEKDGRWRGLDRPEASLIGAQYIAYQRAPRRPWVARRTPAARWFLKGTGLRPGSRFGRGGVEIDHVAKTSPARVQVLAVIPNLFGRGKTAQMTYYETATGARVFAAGRVPLHARDHDRLRRVAAPRERLGAADAMTRADSALPSDREESPRARRRAGRHGRAGSARVRTPGDSAGARVQAAARQPRDAAADRASRDHPPPPPVPGGRARDAAGAGSCTARPRPARGGRRAREVERRPRGRSRAGYDTRSRPRKPGDTSVFFFHAERHEEPRGRSIFDFTRPKALIYANAPGRPLVLVGAMWSTRDGEVGPTPAGPILRWHSHVVCKAGKKRGLKPPGERRLPAGLAAHPGSERDAPRLVHEGPSQRLRDQRAEARALPRRVPAASACRCRRQPLQPRARAPRR